MTGDYRFMQIIQTLLSNRRFFVTLAGKSDGRRNMRNGLPHREAFWHPRFLTSVPMIDPYLRINSVKHYIRANDSAISLYKKIVLKQWKQNYRRHWTVTGNHYWANYPKPNPSKTDVCAFCVKKRAGQQKIGGETGRRRIYSL